MTTSVSELGLAMVMIPIAIFFCAFVIGSVWFMLKVTVDAYRERNTAQMFVVFMGWLIIVGVALILIGAAL